MDELVIDRIARHFQRFRDHLAQNVWIRAVADHYEFAIVEFVRPARLEWVDERDGECTFGDIGKLHRWSPCRGPQGGEPLAKTRHLAPGRSQQRFRA